MGNVNNKNYYTVQGWMVNELGLKGTALQIYAIIYGFSQAEGTMFTGSLQYLADWTGSTKQGVRNNLKQLVEKGLLERHERVINGVVFVDYRSKILKGVVKNFEGGGQKFLPHNIEDKIEDNKDIKEKYKKEIRHEYGEYHNVLLTDSDLAKLKAEFPSDWQARIDNLSIGIQSKGYKYKDHLATIRNWARRDGQNNNPKANTMPNGKPFIEGDLPF